MIFKSLYSKEIITENIIDYCKDYLETNPDDTIYIGTDSQNHRRFSAYTTCIAFRKFQKGVHVIYTSNSVPKIRDKFTRLWKELEYSIELASMLQDHGFTISAIELDFNKKKTTGSNMMIAPAVGYAIGLGFDVITKPDELVACKAADYILRS